MNWCFVFPKFVTGGLETYVLRMCTFLHNRGDKVYLAALSVSDTMERQFQSSDTEIVIFKRWNRKHIADYFKDKVNIFISFGLRDYQLIGKYANNSVSFLYCVLPYHLTPAANSNNKHIILFIKNIVYKNAICSGIQNKTLLVMDENVVDTVKNYYGVCIPDNLLLYLPFKTASNPKKWVYDGNEGLNILTICRADFPFKSYVLGLIDAVDNLISRGKKISLTIVSYGSSFEEIQRKVGNKKYINLIGETPYEKLESYYLKSDIYVGMGSTVVEAANYGIPSIIANVNSPTFMSCGYFHENPTSKGILGEKSLSGEKLLYDLIQLPYEELKAIGLKSKSEFNQYYNIESYTNKILDIYKFNITKT